MRNPSDLKLYIGQFSINDPNEEVNGTGKMLETMCIKKNVDTLKVLHICIYTYVCIFACVYLYIKVRCRERY